ncbi:MAG: hypothetical protein WAT76_09480, partial [Dokdonella sp.]|uniref:hypothetical protein n=1 Tax=Dokdonella sp. TaxID=2291710 RepID=UPI003BAF8AD4
MKPNAGWRRISITTRSDHGSREKARLPEDRRAEDHMPDVGMLFMAVIIAMPPNRKNNTIAIR